MLDRIPIPQRVTPDRLKPDESTISLHYGRAGRGPSRRGLCVSALMAMALLTAALLIAPSAGAQYPGQIKTDKDKEKEAPSLRAVAVLEWTGDLAKPKTSRLVPIAVFDGEQLQDAGVYMARPAPLALSGGVEYILQKDGSKLGLFDVMNAGQEQGAWVGFGSWKPMPRPKAPPASAQKIDEDFNSDKPVLHRKNGSGGGDSKSGSDTGSGNQGSSPDPDRPTLHKKSSDDSKSGDDSSQTSSSVPTDPDRPTLHKAPDSKAPDASPTSGQAPSQTSGQTPTQTSGQSDGQPSSGSSGTSTSTASSDPDRPALKRGKVKQELGSGYVSYVDNTDPDRPKLARGKSTVNGPDITPTLIGLPSGMEQAVAISDPRNHPDHPWNYTWADPADELKMKTALEDAARTALGLQATTPPAPAVKRTATTAKAKAKAAPPPEPAPLVDEEFRVFELAYGSGATLVLTAHTDGPLEHQKYVTLIGQPDLYGSLRVLFKSVTDGSHLDDTPRMRLVDAVDVLADNRGELLFELRGNGQRQFALYRVLRGTATQLFVTGGGATSIEALN